jgi:mannose-6-phosphate isomerase
MCLEGNFTIEFEGNITEVSKGDTILIPASIDELTLLTDGEVTMLEVYVP